MCFTLFMVTRIHSITKITKMRNSETRWMERCPKRKLIDTQGESIINTVTKELVSSENIVWQPVTI